MKYPTAARSLRHLGPDSRGYMLHLARFVNFIQLMVPFLEPVEQ